MPKAIVASSSRKYVKILNQKQELLPGVLNSKDLSTVVGDQVIYELQPEKAEVLVSEVLERKNLLSRSSNNKTKELASNIDLIIIVSAPKPLFNQSFIDRVITTAASQKIEVIILINKVDLELEETKAEIEIYKKIGFKILYSSTKKEDGLKNLRSVLENPDLNIVCLLGISGVGKSSIINKLCPEQELRIDDVSAKSGQGRQTTTVAHAYRYGKLLLVDLPGIQNFGVMHLNTEALKAGFPEIAESAKSCKFADCSHQEEPGCNVKRDLEAGAISPSRYQSFLSIGEELKLARSY